MRKSQFGRSVPFTPFRPANRFSHVFPIPGTLRAGSAPMKARIYSREAPTRYWPSVTIEMAVATQVLIFTKEGGHIRVGTTIWTRSDYLLDAVIWSASQLLRERLTAEGLEVEDFLDDSGAIVA